MKRTVLVGIITLILGAAAGYFIGYNLGYGRGNKSGINTFAECAQAGNQIQESYPERCITGDGRSFTNPDQTIQTAPGP